MHLSLNQTLITFFECKSGNRAIVLIVMLAGFALTTNAFAAEVHSPGYMQLAVLDSGDNANEMNDGMADIAVDDESEIGAIVSFAKQDEQLGSFSLEDGSMVGVYGDGEYGE